MLHRFVRPGASLLAIGTNLTGCRGVYGLERDVYPMPRPRRETQHAWRIDTLSPNLKENAMLDIQSIAPTERYARAIAASKRIRWDIDNDVIRGRALDVTQKYLPDGLSLVEELPFLTAQERRFMSQIQGRTYANIFGLVERYINVKILELSRNHWFGDQVALEALVRFSEEELKHQEMFRRVEALAARAMPPGYRLMADPNDVARFVLGKSTWAVLGLTSHIEIFTQVHYKKSIESDPNLSPLWKDVFFRHWQEESQHAILDELEWRREDAKLKAAERDAAVDDLIALVAGVDGILRSQAQADAQYFLGAAERPFSFEERGAIEANVLKAYRWQYIVSGVQDGRFVGVLASLVTQPQLERISAALAPLM